MCCCGHNSFLSFWCSQCGLALKAFLTLKLRSRWWLQMHKWKTVPNISWFSLFQNETSFYFSLSLYLEGLASEINRTGLKMKTLKTRWGDYNSACALWGEAFLQRVGGSASTLITCKLFVPGWSAHTHSSVISLAPSFPPVWDSQGISRPARAQ